MSRRGGQAFKCSLCEVHCKSQESLAAHMRGRGHQLTLDRQREAARNVFVRGFPKHATVTSDLLKELFQQYGEVEGVFLKDVYAIVTFKSESSAVSALQSPPLMRDKRLVVKPRNLKPRPRAGAAVMEVDEPRYSIPVSDEVIDLVGRADRLSEQVELLSRGCAMSEQTVSHILALSHQLHCRLSTLYPDSLLLPFGSLITGHGTTTSDCDLTLLTHPHHPHLFTPDSYYPPKVLELSRRPPHSPPSPTSSVSGSSTHSTPEHPIRSQLEDHETLRAVAGVVRRVGGCERVFVIESARVPIVRFYHSPSKLHVDLSANNTLGPHNSRLLRAYSEFDPRVTPVVRVVRLWMREVTQRRVNSYAVSLMVIHALQATTPPVLPCLQDLGPWPRNMDWFKQYHTPSDHVTSGPWSCDFVPAASLMSSSNTDGVDALLIHFYRYYASLFPWQQQIVTIHRTTPISKEDADKLLEHPLQASPLIVQDPFDHAHNVCKNVSHSVFTYLMAKMREALQVLTGVSPRLLELFRQHTPPPVQERVKGISLNMECVSGLLKSRESPLVTVLSELNLTNQITRNSVHCVIAHCVASIMRDRFGFVCEPVPSHVTSFDDRGTVSKEHVTTTEDTMTLPEDHMLPPDDNVATQEDHMTIVEDDALTLSKDLTTAPEDHMTLSKDHVTPQAGPSDGVKARKRTRSSSSSDLSSDESKRVKSRPAGPSPLEVLQSTVTPLPHTHTYHCTAHENTWVGSRRRRREGVRGLLSALPTSTQPILELTLSVVPSDHPEAAKISRKNSVCVLCVYPISPRHKIHCDQWFSVFKPLLLSLTTERDPSQ